REALDGGDLGAVGLGGEQHAALHRPPVEQYGARAAVAGVAADVRARQIEVVAEEVDEEPARLDLALVALAVHGHPDRLPAHAAFRTAGAARTSARCRR